MDYTKREARTAESRAKLLEVAKAGETLAFWRVIEGTGPTDGESWRWVEVETPDGTRFSLRGGSWGREGAISAALTSIKGAHGIGVAPSDVLGYKEGAHEASASCDRPAEAIAKDFNRRVTAAPEALAVGAKMRERLASQMARRDSLAVHVADLQRMGYVFNQYTPSQAYDAEGWHSGDVKPRRLKVYATGAITTEVDTPDVATFGRLVALLNDRGTPNAAHLAESAAGMIQAQEAANVTLRKALHGLAQQLDKTTSARELRTLAETARRLAGPLAD